MAAPTRSPWARTAHDVRAFFSSGVRGRARLLSAAMVGLLLAISGLNVVNSYVGRDFMTALVNRQGAEFYRLAVLYVGVFAASTVTAAVQSYAQGRLGLLWRAWFTDRLVARYLWDRTYVRLRTAAGVDNPDERISEDVRAFADSALGFVVLLLNGAITVVAFAGVTWSISPVLFGVCVGYAALGSAGTVLLGRRLAGLNAVQLAREADFRAALIHIRENAAPVALVRAEPPLRRRVVDRLASLVANFRTILGVNFRVGLYIGGYNYLIQIIPALVVGPMYLRGEVEFGVVTQAAMAFAQLVGALSLVITQFGSITSFAAVASRVNGLSAAMEHDPAQPVVGITVAEAPDRVAFEGLTLASPDGKRVLVGGLSAAVAGGGRLAVTGRNEPAQTALFRATAGLWEAGRGRIVRPPLADVLFVPQTPYMIPGTLRDQFRPLGPAADDDRQVRTALAAVGLADLADHVGGLDAEHDWAHSLSHGEQQALSLARVVLARPRFAVLDRVHRSLGAAATADVFRHLADAGAGVILFTGPGEPPEGFDRAIELKPDGSWSVRDVKRAGGPVPGDRMPDGSGVGPRAVHS